MEIFTTIKDLRGALDSPQLKKAVIGFVPTMGALHEGHLSLLKEARNGTDKTVTSIFVNPTQFNDKNDLKNYPRNFNKDCDLLKAGKCDFVFAPEVSEMYPEEDTRIFDFGNMGNVMEGAHRPGHFNGVAQIVTKLFDAVKPHKAYFGQKDFQQLAIIKQLVKDQKYPIEIVPCPIIREADGLAMSSRNQLLTAEHRKAAPFIYKTLNEVLNKSKSLPVEELIAYVENSFRENPLLNLEYFQLVNTNTLESIHHFDPQIPVTACIAVFAGNIRLIDNIRIIS